MHKYYGEVRADSRDDVGSACLVVLFVILEANIGVMLFIRWGSIAYRAVSWCGDSIM